MDDFLISRMNSQDKVILLEPMEGKSTKAASGLIDNRLFTGENKLHAYQDSASTLWYLKYDIGGLPPALKDIKFTRFSDLMKFVERYFAKRNIKVTLQEIDNVKVSYS